jgi:hypothetical protein
MLPAGYSTLGNTTTWQEVNANEAEEYKDWLVERDSNIYVHKLYVLQK